MTTTAARTPVEPVEPAIEAVGAVPEVQEERLLAWRDVLVEAATAALRTYRSAWSADDLDDAARATAGVGALDGQSALEPDLPLGGMVPGAGPSAAGRGRPRIFHDVLPPGGTLAATVNAAGLTPGEEALLAAAWWTAVDPQLAVVFGCLHDDSSRRWATPATVRLALTRLGLQVPVVVGEDSSLVRLGLLDPAPGPDHPLTLTAAAADLLSGSAHALPATAQTAPRLAPVAERLADLVAGGGRVVVRCVADDDRVSLRDAVAERLALPVARTSRPPGLADLLLRLGRELPAVVLGGGQTPPEGCILALGPSDASAPPGWHTVEVPAPTLTQAATAWGSALRTAGARVGRSDLAAYASRIPLGERGIGEVVARAAAAAEARGERLTGDDVAVRTAEPLVPWLSRGLRGQGSLQVLIRRYGADAKLVLSQDLTERERSEAMRRDFVANVSHELRTPLTVVGGFLETLEDMEVPDPEMSKRAIELMRQQTSRMTRLVDDLLTLSRLESTQNPLREEDVNVPEMLRALHQDAQVLSAGRHRIRVTLESSEWLKGNTEELRSAFGNLISNAVRYTPENGEIEIRWEVRDGNPAFAVRDTGIGIEPQHIARLTERFYRVDRSRSRETGGTGLGLAIVKHVLNRHQAYLDIQSTPGSGSTFSVMFPDTRRLGAGSTLAAKVSA